MARIFYIIILFALCLCVFGCAVSRDVQVIDLPDTKLRNDFYVSNRHPLKPSPLIKLPIDAIEPQGWLRRQLQLQADGFVGNLTEISRYLKKQDNAWLSPDGKGHSPWEEVPYWLRGFGDTGYLLSDQRIINETRLWIEAVIASQRQDGYFGPRANLTFIKDKPDLWPNMVMLNVLQSYYEYSGDQRVLGLMDKYFKWQLNIPDEDFLLPFWQQQRASDNLASVYWFYNITGKKWLLDVAEKIHRNTADWTDGIVSWHGVNIAQCFRAPAIFYQQSENPQHLQAAERNYQTVMGIYGQVPGGMFGADENCREGFIGPRQAAETCAMVEMMRSCEMLLKVTGNPIWADRCEQVAFNSFPASMTPDLKALHYLTSPNMILCDSRSKSPGLQNSGPMFLFDPYRHRCCQHNVAHGWPHLTEHLWLATPDNGLAAVIYAPSKVTARVGNATEVSIVENTRYPFEQDIELTIETARPVKFPLYLRVPGWCKRPYLKLNGRFFFTRAHPNSYMVITREWSDGDTVVLNLPMKITVTKWERNQNSISVNRGPLTYSLRIGEGYVRAGGTDDWPAWEIHPTSDWNYGLILDPRNQALSFKLVRKTWPQDEQPFDANAAPIELRAHARKIHEWQMDHLGLVGRLQPCPVKSSEPTEVITLIPMGCARLRISAFPQIGIDRDAHRWILPAKPIPSIASHCWWADTVDALSDQILPKSSNDQTIARFTWWDHKGTTEWVQYDFNQPKTIYGSSIYWFEDTAAGGCRVPKFWQLLYRENGQWKKVSRPTYYGTEKDMFNKVIFEPVRTSSLRLEVQLQQNFSGGILEWLINEQK
jgi:hypothetical protein